MRFPIHDEATGHMCFSAAVLVLKRGGTVRRANSHERDAFFYDADSRMFCHELGLLRVSNIAAHDIMATDWIEVGENT